MSYAGYPNCIHNFKKSFWENMRDRHVTFSCMYYWKRPHLVKSFIREIGGTAYDSRYGTVSPELDPRNIKSLNKVDWIKQMDLCGNFPYRFSPSLVCVHCKQLDVNPNKPNSW